MMQSTSVVQAASCKLTWIAVQSISLAWDNETEAPQDRLALVACQEIAESDRRLPVLRPREHHATLFQTRVGVHRHLPIAALVSHNWGLGQRQWNQPRIGAGIDKLRGLHHIFPKD